MFIHNIPIHCSQVAILYPTMAQKTMAIFDCIPFMDSLLLRIDPAEHCYTRRWAQWMVAAVTGAAIYCFAIPLVAMRAAWSGMRGSKARQRLVKVCQYAPDLLQH